MSKADAYKEIITVIKANLNYELNLIKRHKEAAKEYGKSIKKFEAKIRELEQK